MTTRVIPPHEGKTVKAARVRLGSYEFEKKGVSRFDLRDPYHFAVALTWPRFIGALLAFRRFGAKPDKKIVDRQAASPSSWKTPFMAAWMAS